MAATVWKGHLTFGLVSIPVKLHRAARAEKVSFRQLHAATGARVRQALVAQAPPPEWDDAEDEVDEPPVRAASSRSAPPAAALPPVQPRPASAAPAAPPRWEAPPEPREVKRSELAKGYEYARDRYIMLTREDLEKITPQTAREMQILEFVKLEEVDPIYFETSYYASPDKGGERAYSLLYQALRDSGYVGLAQVAMHNREHIVVIRPGRSGIVLHTMYYESEIRRDDEYRADTLSLDEKELKLALLLINNLAGPFEPAKYRDTYKEKIEALIQARIEGQQTIEVPEAKPAPVINILEALQRSLENTAKAAPERKPPAAEKPRQQHRRRSEGK